MKRLEERLLSHPVAETIPSLRRALEALPADTVEAADEHGPSGAIDRAHVAVDHIEGLITGVDPRLVTQVTLDAIHGSLDQALQAASNLTSDPGPYGANLDQAIESALQQAAPLAGATASFAKQTQKIGRKLGGALTVKVKELEGEAEMIAEELKELEGRRESGLQELTTQQEERRTELAARLDELQQVIDAEKQRVSSLTTEFQEQFSEGQKTRTADFETLLQEVRERAETPLEEVEGIRDQVRELYAIITDTSTAGAFHDEAKEQTESADRWRRVAVGFGTAAAVIAVAAVGIAATLEVSASVILAKVAATVAAGVVATYAGRQSAHHRRRADQAKDLELELVAVEGFLHSHPEEEQRELRRGYFDRAFRGRSAPTEPVTNGLESGFGLTPELLGALAAVAKALQQK